MTRVKVWITHKDKSYGISGDGRDGAYAAEKIDFSDPDGFWMLIPGAWLWYEWKDITKVEVEPLTT